MQPTLLISDTEQPWLARHPFGALVSPSLGSAGILPPSPCIPGIVYCLPRIPNIPCIQCVHTSILAPLGPHRNLDGHLWQLIHHTNPPYIPCVHLEEGKMWVKFLLDRWKISQLTIEIASCIPCNLQSEYSIYSWSWCTKDPLFHHPPPTRCKWLRCESW